jgi:hypothetical protein
MTGGGSAGGRVPGRGRSLIGVLHDVVRPGDSGPGPEGGRPNPLSGTALRSLSGLSINVSIYSSSDPTRHGREGNWACMREPIPHPITAEKQREDLGIVRPVPRARAVGGWVGGWVRRGRGGGRRRRVRGQGDVADSGESEWNLRNPNGGKQCRQQLSPSVSEDGSLLHPPPSAFEEPPQFLRIPGKGQGHHEEDPGLLRR